MGNPTGLDNEGPAYVPSQFQPTSSVGRMGSFRHQNRNLIASQEQQPGLQKQAIINASAYKQISNQRPSVYRNINKNINKNYPDTINLDEETANFGAMMEFHHSPQQDFFKRNQLGDAANGMENSNGLQIGRLQMPRESFHQSGAMSDSGAAGQGRQHRSNSHANLDPKSFLSPIAGNNMATGFNNNGLNVPQSQAKTQDRRFAPYDQYNSQPNQFNNYIQRRHKTPNELSSGIVHQGAANMAMATPLKSSVNIGTTKSKFSEQQNRIQKYPPDGTPATFKNQNGSTFGIG